MPTDSIDIGEAAGARRKRAATRERACTSPAANGRSSDEAMRSHRESRQAQRLRLAGWNGELPVACQLLQHDVMERLVLSCGEPDDLGDPHLDVAKRCGCVMVASSLTRQANLPPVAC
jgi:hypothetical protein